MKIFVTVGTTKFDSLIHTIFTGAVQKALSDKKYTQMVVQFGRSNCFDENTTLDTSELKLDLCEKFSLRPDIIEYIKQADLIIGHAGAGTCLEGKRRHIHIKFRFHSSGQQRLLSKKNRNY